MTALPFSSHCVKFRFIAPFGRVNRNNGKWKMYNVKCRYKLYPVEWTHQRVKFSSRPLTMDTKSE